MADFTERFSEVCYPLGRINPASYNSEQNTGSVSVRDYHRIAIVIHAGVLGQNVDVDVEQATTTGGAGLKALAANSKDIALTATTDNNTVSVIEIRTEEFDVAGGFDCINLEMTPAGSSSIFGAIIYGIVPRYAPAPTTNYDTITD